jgi:hypothetical protein
MYGLQAQVLQSKQATDTTTYSFSYGYNLAGSLAWEVYPSGRFVSYGFDEAGRVASATGKFNGSTTPRFCAHDDPLGAMILCLCPTFPLLHGEQVEKSLRTLRLCRSFAM